MMHRDFVPIPDEHPIWERNDGIPLSGFEKMLLDRNFDELRKIAQDYLEDGVLIGCSEAQMRESFQTLLNSLVNPYVQACQMGESGNSK